MISVFENDVLLRLKLYELEMNCDYFLFFHSEKNQVQAVWSTKISPNLDLIVPVIRCNMLDIDHA